MPSGWDAYYVVFLAAALALGIPLTLALLSRLLSPARPAPDVSGKGPSSYFGSSKLGVRINSRIFLGANVSILLLALALILIPFAVTIQSAACARGAAVMASLAVFAGLGLLYASRKGDLDWLRSYSSSLGATAAPSREREGSSK